MIDQQAHYRAAKASLSLNLLDDAKSFCQSGIEKDPNNEELKKLARQIDVQKSEKEQREAEISKAVTAAKVQPLLVLEVMPVQLRRDLHPFRFYSSQGLLSAIENRKLKLGKAMFQELTGLKKPALDKNNILHWPVLLLYAEVMSSDFIEDFCESDMLSAHLDMISSMS